MGKACHPKYTQTKKFHEETFSLRKHAHPKLITLVYWLLLLASILGGVGSMFGGFEAFTLGKFFPGYLYAACGALAARIWCELLIVLFKMNEALKIFAINEDSTASSKTWNDDRGFGFHRTPTQGGQKFCSYIKAFNGLRGRPQSGQRVTFEVGVWPPRQKRATR